VQLDETVVSLATDIVFIDLQAVVRSALNVKKKSTYS
jgi:hypothetical protein